MHTTPICIRLLLSRACICIMDNKVQYFHDYTFCCVFSVRGKALYSILNLVFVKFMHNSSHYFYFNRSRLLGKASYFVNIYSNIYSCIGIHDVFGFTV